MKKFIFNLVLLSFFSFCFFTIKFPVILTYGMIISTVDLLFSTNLLRSSIYTEIFILTFILSIYITYRLKNYFYNKICK